MSKRKKNRARQGNAGHAEGRMPSADAGVSARSDASRGALQRNPALHATQDRELMRRVLRSMIERFEREFADPETKPSVSPSQVIAAMKMLDKLNRDEERDSGDTARHGPRTAAPIAGHPGGNADATDAGEAPATRAPLTQAQNLLDQIHGLSRDTTNTAPRNAHHAPKGDYAPKNTDPPPGHD